jgi:hydrogenase maturation factor
MELTEITNCINCLSNYSKSSGVYFSIDKGSVMVHFEFTKVPEKLGVPKLILKNLRLLVAFIDSFDTVKKVTFGINGNQIEIGHKYNKTYSNETYFINSDSFEEFLERAANDKVFQNSLIGKNFYN